MPKHISYHVLWSPEERAYVLRNPDGVQVLLQNDDAWHNAFTNITSFVFTSHTGAHYTIRREKAQRVRYKGETVEPSWYYGNSAIPSVEKMSFLSCSLYHVWHKRLML